MKNFKRFRKLFLDFIPDDAYERRDGFVAVVDKIDSGKEILLNRDDLYSLVEHELPELVITAAWDDEIDGYWADGITAEKDFDNNLFGYALEGLDYLTKKYTDGKNVIWEQKGRISFNRQI